MANSLPWLRLYSNTVDNEKIRLVAFEDRWHYIALLCLKQQGVLDDKSDLLERKIAVKLGVQLRELDEIKRRLIEVNLINDDFEPIGWENKQFSSDSSTERTRKYREKKKKKQSDNSETSQERHGDAIDTDTDTDTDTDNKKTPSEVSAEKVANHLHKKLTEEIPEASTVKPESWITEIERAIRLDGRTEKQLINIIDWIYSDGTFWIPNIQSGKKLREKYVTMVAQSRRPSQDRKPANDFNNTDYSEGTEGFITHG